MYAVMAIPTTYLPNNSIYFTYAYNTSVAIVNQIFRNVPEPIYLQMVYNLGGANLITWAQDPTGAPPYKTLPPSEEVGYFNYWRQIYGLNTFTPGVVVQSSDVSTMTTLVVPESLKNLTIQDLQLVKTPWGRQYLGYAQAWNRPWGST